MRSRLFKSSTFILLVLSVYISIFLIYSFALKTAKYRNYILLVTFEYPKDWKALEGEYIISGKTSRYEGEDGFFQVGVISESDETIYSIADNEANQISNPYGSYPEIKKLNIMMKEFVFIIPSLDQPPEMNKQACFIVKYPNRIAIGGDEYDYFILWADKDNIEKMAESFNFISY